MFHWNAGLYMDEKVKKKPVRYRRMVERSKKRLSVRQCYCITLPANEINCMDIYSSREFWLRYYQEKEIEIIGLASDQEGVEEILGRMFSDILGKYGDINAGNVRRFFQGEVDEWE